MIKFNKNNIFNCNFKIVFLNCKFKFIFLLRYQSKIIFKPLATNNTKITMVGKKGYKYSENQIVEVAKNTADNVENSEFILDLDELHVNVSPPSELNENCSPKTEGKNHILLYSLKVF